MTAADGVPNGVSMLRRSMLISSGNEYRPVPPITPNASAIALVLQRVDARKIPALLVVVHAEAEHVTIRNLDADEVRADARRSAVVKLAAEYRDQDAPRALIETEVADRAQRVALVENVVGQQHGAAEQFQARLLDPEQFAAARAAAIARRMHVVEFQIGRNRQRERTAENQATVHDGQEHRCLTVQALGNRAAH